MMPTYTITTATLDDLPLLAPIELAAARMLVGYAPESVLTETTSLEDLAEAHRHGRLWIARADGAPVGFAQVSIIEAGAAHLDEIDVHPEHGRRGLGQRLVRAVCDWASTARLRAVTLTTFRDVPWNMPFYARLQFEVISPAMLTPALQRIVSDETRRGLDPTRRVVMRRLL